MMKGFQRNIASVMKKVAVTMAIATIALIKTLRDASKAYDYQTQQETKLAVVMKQRMNATSDMINSVKKLTAEQQKLGVIGDEIQLSGAQQLSTFLRQGESLKTLIPAMNNLAAQQNGVNVTGENMVNIANMMGKVLDGQVGALRRVGISFSAAEEAALKNGNEQERAAVLAKVITNNVGEMNKALANTPEGRSKQLANSFGDLKEEIGKAIVPLRDILVPLLQRIVNIATAMAVRLQSAFGKLAAFINALFGRKQTQSATVSTNNVTDSVSALGDAYEETGKKAKGSVAGFDEVNSLADTSAGGSASEGADGGLEDSVAGVASLEMPEIDTSGFDGARESATKLREKLAELWQVIKDNEAIIVTALGALAGAFVTLKIAMNFGTITAAFKGLMILLGTLSAPVVLIGAAIGGLTAAFIYFYKTNETFRGVVDGVLNKIKDAALFLWNNVLKPLGSFIKDVFVKAWDILTIAMQWLYRNVLKPVGDFLLVMWKSIIVPLARVVGGLLSIAFETLADIAKSFWKNVMVPLGNFFKDIFTPLVEALSAVFEFLWNYAIKPLAEGISSVLTPIFEAMGVAIEFVWQKILKPLAEYVGKAFFSAFDVTFKMIGDIINGLKKTFIGILDFITGVFTGDWGKAWGGVKDIFKGIFDSLYGVVKVPLNLIISSVNKLIRGLNKLKVNIPAIPGISEAITVGFSLAELTPLAKGGITNGPMAALIGDNPGGREVVSPLSDLKDMILSAVTTAMISMNTSNSQGASEVVMNVDGVKLARVLLPSIDKENSRIGRRTIIQGV